MDFDELADEQTKITLSHVGWPDEPQWAAVYSYFDKAWDEVLADLIVATEKIR